MIDELEIEVSAGDIDSLGHVNNARFLEYFEAGRIRWYNQCGRFLEPSGDPRLGTVVVNINVNFRRECFLGDRLKVITRPRERRRSSYVLDQIIEDSGSRVVADAAVTSVVMDLDTRHTVELPDELAKQFNEAGPEQE